MWRTRRPPVVESPDGTYLYIAEYSGAVTVASVASFVALGIECTGRHSESAEWVAPELVSDGPAFV